jgi:hypothetical protein
VRARLISIIVSVSALTAPLLAGCPADVPDLDQDPPRIVSVDPAGPVVPTQTAFTITFSESLNPVTVLRDDEGETVVLAERDQVSEAFVNDISSPPLSESRKDDIVPADLEMAADNTQIVLTPRAALLPGTAYTLLVSRDVRDTSGNPIYGGATGARETFRFDVVTDDGPPNLIDDDVTGFGAIPPNRRRFTVTFDQPVIGLGTDTVAIDAVDGAAQAMPAVTEAVLISEERDRATLVLADAATCERLAPNAAYELRVGPGITDSEGETMPTQTVPFTTGGACDLGAHVVLSSQAIAGEVDATIRFETNKASTTAVRFGLVGRELDCLGTTPCPVFGTDATDPLPGTSPPRFGHGVVVTGLSLNESYAYAATAEDLTGQTVTVEGTFTTSVLPKVAVNEVMANASSDQVPPNGSERDGEYIELHNYGDVEVDLSGWAIEVDGGDAGEGKTCPFPIDGSAPYIAPGGFLVVTGSGFVPSDWGLAETDIWRGPNANVCDSLRNGAPPQPVMVVDEDGRPISSFSGFASLLPDEDGRSIERTSPDAPDLVDSFCYSNPQVGPTPGAANGVAPGCDE